MIHIKNVDTAIGMDATMEPTALDNVFISKEFKQVAICQETADGQEICIVVDTRKLGELVFENPFAVH